jgi:hypothetical protein
MNYLETDSRSLRKMLKKLPIDTFLELVAGECGERHRSSLLQDIPPHSGAGPEVLTKGVLKNTLITDGPRGLIDLVIRTFAVRDPEVLEPEH